MQQRSLEKFRKSSVAQGRHLSKRYDSDDKKHKSTGRYQNHNLSLDKEVREFKDRDTPTNMNATPKDLYVKDHLWRGSYLFPTVFGLCAMAQAVAYLTGTSNPPISSSRTKPTKSQILDSPSITRKGLDSHKSISPSWEAPCICALKFSTAAPTPPRVMFGQWE